MRGKTEIDRRFWLAACWDCHREVLQYMDKAVQLAIKKRVDPAYYDLAEFNRVYRNAKSRAVTEAEVDEAEKEIP